MVEASIRKQRKKILKTTSSHTHADHGVVALRAPAEAAAAAQQRGCFRQRSCLARAVGWVIAVLWQNGVWVPFLNAHEGHATVFVWGGVVGN